MNYKGWFDMFMTKGINALSLFDGMSCGQIALSRSGITVNTYYAAELDKYAITVTQNNWPDTVQLGDVIGWRDWDVDWSSISLLIGGSPCQGFSFAGKQLAFDDHRSKLFFVYVDILNHIRSVNPAVKFMLENVKMKKEYLDVISSYTGVEPVLINSSLLSAQNRQRYYWFNWGAEQPEDKGILLKDILEHQGTGWIKNHGEWSSRNKKSQCIDANYHKGGNHSDIDIMVIQKPRGFNKGGMKALDGKTPTLSSCSWEHNNHLSINATIRRFTPVECERLQTVPDNYTQSVSNTQRYKMLGNCWTVDVVKHILDSSGLHE